MARYEHLTLYKDVYDFNLYFFKLSRGFPKDFKYGLAQEIKTQTTYLLSQVILANENTDKRLCLAKATICLELIKVRVRMLMDLGIIRVRSYEFICRCLTSITKQITAWKAWAAAKLNN